MLQGFPFLFLSLFLPSFSFLGVAFERVWAMTKFGYLEGFPLSTPTQFIYISGTLST